jgi:hypothetical protein
MSNLRLKSKSPERNLKSKSSKSSDKRSCFACNEIGHVNSCCPNRVRRSYRKSVSPTRPSPHRSKPNTLSGPSMTFKERMQTLPPPNYGSSNRCEGSSNTSQGSRFSNVSMNHAPRNLSPRNSGSPVQKKTSYRSVSPHDGVGLLPTPTNLKANSNLNYYNRYNSQVQNNNGPSSSRQLTQRSRQTSPTPRTVANNSRQPTTVPSTGNGYWTEMIITDEKGNPKSIKAWVLHDN